MPFRRCILYALSKVGKTEIVLESEQLQVVHHMYMYDGSNVYSVTIIYKVYHIDYGGCD